MTEHLLRYQQRFHQFAKANLPENPAHFGKLYDAVHYSFFAAGGKRLRPALVYATAESLGIELSKVDALALAIECIHTYSLIHDDLPAMDDDDLRRGQPACHKQFDEATAILAGDALNTFAFEILSRPVANLSTTQQLKHIQLLSQCAGMDGMVGGQDTDLQCENQPNAITLPTLSHLHTQKTAKLIEACLLGAYLSAEQICSQKADILSDVALSLGLFYQIQDDILDVTQSSDVLGKPGGSDADNAKATYVSLLGLTAAQSEAERLEKHIIAQLQQFFAPKTDYQTTPLATIIEVIKQRQH